MTFTPNMTLCICLAEVADDTGVSPGDIMGNRQHASSVKARRLFIKKAWFQYKQRQVDIAAFLGMNAFWINHLIHDTSHNTKRRAA